jgi:hypothetical protein
VCVYIYIYIYIVLLLCRLSELESKIGEVTVKSDPLSGLVVGVPGYRMEMYCVSCAVLVRVRVRVTLQLTVSQSVCLGVEPNLGLLTRDIFF